MLKKFIPSKKKRHYSINELAVYKGIFDFLNLLIGAEGVRLLRKYGAGETPQARVAPRRAPRHARGKRAPGAEINSII
jgi:hypothetical protein